MSNYPDNMNWRAFDAAQGRDDDALPEWDPFAKPTIEDLAALRDALSAHETMFAALKRRPWTFDFVNTVSHDGHCAETEAVIAQLKAAVQECEARLNGGYDQ